MSKCLTVLASILLCAFAAAATYAQPLLIPPPSSAPDTRGTASQPLVINDLILKKSAADAAGDRDHASNERMTALSTLGLAVVTAILATFTYFLWLANKKLVEGAEATANRQAQEMRDTIAEATRSATAMEQIATAMRANTDLIRETTAKQFRAYVTVDTDMATYQDARLPFGAGAKLSNSGFTPAKNLSYRIKAAIIPMDQADTYDFDDNAPLKAYEIALSPRQEYRIKEAIPTRFSDAEVEAIKQGTTRRLFLWGTVYYDDIFGGHWWTSFCHNHNFYIDVKGTERIESAYHHKHSSMT